MAPSYRVLRPLVPLNGETAAKCNGFLKEFRKGVTVLGLKISEIVFSVLLRLNRSLQAENATVSVMMEAVKGVRPQLCKPLQAERRCISSETINDVNRQIAECDLFELIIPRIQRAETLFSGPTEARIPPSVEEHYCCNRLL